MNFGNITRKAMLIACPGAKPNYLKGVQRDMENMTRFLQSDKGGSWKSHEIIQLHNPTRFEVRKAVQAAVADYSLVYFSGHGYTDQSNYSRMLALREAPMADIELLNASPRQLVIVDACRTYVSEGLAGPPMVKDDVDHFDKVSTYELFSERIALSPAGKMIVHATQPGRPSLDSSMGGLFTRALLHVSERMHTKADYEPCTIGSILNRIPTVLKHQNISQIPCVTFNRGHLTVPFALSMSSLDKIKKSPVINRPSPQMTMSGAMVLGIASIVLVSILAAGTSSS